MSVNTTQLFEKIKTLPPRRLAEVEDFVDFLKGRDTQARDLAGQRLAEAMAKLDALALPAMSAQEVQAEIRAVRAGQSKLGESQR